MFRLVFCRTLLSQSAASLTMASTAALLRAHGFPVDLCLLERGAPANARRLCQDAASFPVVFLKANDGDHAETLPLVAEAKRAGVFRRFFACGPFATLNAASLLATFPELDGVILGEPEATALELAIQLRTCQQDASRGRDCLWSSSLPGGHWRDPLTGQLVRAPVRAAISSLDGLPLPARDVERGERAALVNLETQRGCPSSCSFCHVPALRPFSPGPRRRFRSVARVVDELADLRGRLGKRLFIFNDPTFWAGPADTARVTELARLILARGLKIWFMIYLRCAPFPSEATLAALTEAGLVRVFLGVENGEASTLRLYGKALRPDAYERARARLGRHGVSHHIGFILFHPLATLPEVAANLGYLHRIGKLFRVGTIIEKMRLVPGSDLRRRVPFASPADGAGRAGRADPDAFDPAVETVDRAYDYAFQDGRVAALHQGFRDLFGGPLRNAHLEAEFYCANTDLARHIARRVVAGFEQRYAPELGRFDEAKRGYESLLHDYFTGCLDGVRTKAWGAAQVGSPALQASFIRAFWDSLRALAVAWAVMLDRIRSATGSEIVGALFTGEERAG